MTKCDQWHIVFKYESSLQNKNMSQPDQLNKI